MKKHIETKISACGRTFAIFVKDTKRAPFEVGELNIKGDDIKGKTYCFDLKNKAIKKCSELAIEFIG